MQPGPSTRSTVAEPLNRTPPSPKARLDSTTEQDSPATDDCARDSTSEISQRDKARRAAALSDSYISSVSSISTESSRARKALAFTLNTGKDSWSPNIAKSHASVGFSAVGGAFKNMVDLVKPSGSKSLAEELTARLSKRIVSSPSKGKGSIKSKKRTLLEKQSISDSGSEKLTEDESEKGAQDDMVGNSARRLTFTRSSEPEQEDEDATLDTELLSHAKRSASPESHGEIVKEGATAACDSRLHGNACMSSHAEERRGSNSRDCESRSFYS